MRQDTHTHTPSLGCLHETACIGINSIFGSLSWFFLLCLSSAEPLPAANFDTYRLRSCTTTTVKERNCTALLACYSCPHFLESLAPLRVNLNCPCHAQRGLWPHSPDRQTLVTEGWFAAGDLLQTKEKHVLTNCCIIFFFLLRHLVSAAVTVVTAQTHKESCRVFNQVRFSTVWHHHVWFSDPRIWGCIDFVSTSGRPDAIAASMLTQFSDQSHLLFYLTQNNMSLSPVKGSRCAAETSFNISA